MSTALEAPKSFGQRVMLGALGWYQQYRRLQPAACRFLPTCTAYTVEAVDSYGGWRGGWLALRRIARCHPLGGHGYDPVPKPHTCTTTLKVNELEDV